MNSYAKIKAENKRLQHDAELFLSAFSLVLSNEKEAAIILLDGIIETDVSELKKKIKGE